jgi:hypothetical protein
MATNQEKLNYLKTNYPQQYATVSGALGIQATTPQPKVPTTPAVQPQVQAQPQAQAQTGGFNDQIYNQYYAGWGRAEAEADYKATGGSKVTQNGGTTGFSTPETINLPELYKSLYESSGVPLLEKEYSDKEKAYNEAMSKINDNPFLSEASRVGRQQKLSTDFQNAVANLQKDIATKKADIETQLNLQTKQFDINSQAATNALNQLNSLLGMGALDNASGESIANLTRSTGISSDMINSAIQANKAKNVQTQVITSTADSGEVTISVINSTTGEIIEQSSLGKVGNAQTGSGTATKEAEAQQNQQNAVSDIQRGATLRDLITHYVVAGGLTAEEVYRLYNSNSPYGEAKESLDEVKEGRFVS